MIDGALANTGLELDQSIATGAAEVISAGNRHIDGIPAAGDVAFLSQVVQTEVVAQGTVAAQLAAVARGEADIDAVVQNSTGQELESQISAAVVGNILPPTLLISNASSTENDNGQAPYEFTVKLISPSVVPVSVDYTTRRMANRITWSFGPMAPLFN